MVQSSRLFYFFILFFYGMAPATAEYRVFKLQFLNSKTKQTRQIQSTLDPQQYQGIYPLPPDETVTYVQTWRCRGNTSLFKPHCQSPEIKP